MRSPSELRASFPHQTLQYSKEGGDLKGRSPGALTACAEALNQDPEKPLKDGLNPEPLAELRFWRNKAQNLNIYFDNNGGVKT